MRDYGHFQCLQNLGGVIGQARAFAAGQGDCGGMTPSLEAFDHVSEPGGAFRQIRRVNLGDIAETDNFCPRTRTGLIAGGAFLIGWADHFEIVGWGTIGALAVMAVVGVVVDTVAQTAGAQKAGASKEGIWGSLIGTVIGVFMGGLVGILVMPLVGAFVGEFWAKRDLLHAGRVGVATWVGMIVGTAVKVALAFMMLGILILMYFV